MSKNIIIQEGGIPRQLTADKQKTALVGGGNCLWVPEDSVSLIDKTITEDGTYNASTDGAYGYRSVTVRGIGKAVGVDPTTGEEVEVTSRPDPETGEPTITTNVIPSYIHITEPPTKLAYYDREPIDFTGMIVKAFTKTGEIFTDETYPDGIIPMAELVLRDTIARKDEGRFTTLPEPQSEIYSRYGITFSFTTLSIGETIKGNLYNEYLDMWREHTLTNASARVYVTLFKGDTYDYVKLASSAPFTLHYKGPTSSAIYAEVVERDTTISISSSIASTEIQAIKGENSFPLIAVNATYYTGKDMVYYGEGRDPEQYISVLWPCPYGDQKLMPDQFAITVSEAPAGGGGTTEGGGGAGRFD